MLPLPYAYAAADAAADAYAYAYAAAAAAAAPDADDAADADAAAADAAADAALCCSASVCRNCAKALSECTGIIRGKQMPTILTYQTKAALEAESLDTDRLLNNHVGGWPDGGVIIKSQDAMTGSLNEPVKACAERSRTAAEYAIAAILFNAAAIADRWNINLDDLTQWQLQKMEAISQSGRLRALRGHQE